jgi:hypothetical protein
MTGQLAPSQVLVAVDHLLRNCQWLENHYAWFSERFRPYVGERKENLEREFAKIVAKWGDALSPLNAADAPQAACCGLSGCRYEHRYHR